MVVLIPKSDILSRKKKKNLMVMVSLSSEMQVNFESKVDIRL